MTTTETAYELGCAFASYLNSQPNEAQNWSPLEAGDDLPEFDYCELRDQNGGTVSPAIEAAYRDGFNSTFKAV